MQTGDDHGDDEGEHGRHPLADRLRRRDRPADAGPVPATSARHTPRGRDSVLDTLGHTRMCVGHTPRGRARVLVTASWDKLLVSACN